MKRGPNHGQSKTATYVSWRNMMQRCFDKNCTGWKDYGGRGITVCCRWHKFLNFLADMGERPKGTTLNRIENDLDYRPGNCEWADWKRQQNNRRGNKFLTFNDATMTQAQWADRLGIAQRTLHKRLNILAWSLERALSTPVGPEGKKKLNSSTLVDLDPTLETKLRASLKP